MLTMHVVYLPYLYLNREFEMDFLLASIFPWIILKNNYDLILLFIINDFPLKKKISRWSLLLLFFFKYCSVTREPTSKDKKSFNFQR